MPFHLTPFAATDTAIEAMKRGAFGICSKPVDLHQMSEAVKTIECARMSQVPPLQQYEFGGPLPDESSALAGDQNV